MTVASCFRKDGIVELSVDLSGRRVSVRVCGYLSLQAGRNLSALLGDLGRMKVVEIYLDISRCSPVCVGALESLLERKFQLDTVGVKLVFGPSTRTLTKVFGIMGLRPDGDPSRVNDSMKSG